MSDTITVDATVLATAIKAVLPHASTHPDDPPALRTIRFDVAGGLIASATDRFSVAAYRIGEGELLDYEGEIVTFAITRDDAQHILRLFRPGKGDEDMTLDIEVTELAVEITDVSGMFDGRQLSVRNAFGDSYPNALPLIRDALTRTMVKGGFRWIVASGQWEKFAASAKVIGEPLAGVLGNAPGKPWIVTCGAQFVGLLMPLTAAETDHADQSTTLATWADLLPTADTEDAAA